MVNTIWQNPVLLIVVPLGLAFLIPIIGLISKKIVKYIESLICLAYSTISGISPFPWE